MTSASIPGNSFFHAGTQGELLLVKAAITAISSWVVSKGFWLLAEVLTSWVNNQLPVVTFSSKGHSYFHNGPAIIACEALLGCAVYNDVKISALLLLLFATIQIGRVVYSIYTCFEIRIRRPFESSRGLQNTAQSPALDEPLTSRRQVGEVSWDEMSPILYNPRPNRRRKHLRLRRATMEDGVILMDDSEDDSKE
ncbi:hypothetical protein FRB93_001824 [Tulasnella sp. JGI-2019a]|nr:hypothetical protein FRB93_001824 [Tulasnella sp. JGI-2019a]